LSVTSCDAQAIEGCGQPLLSGVYARFGALYALLPRWLSNASRRGDMWTFQALLSSYLLTWRPSDAELITACGVVACLQHICSLPALAATIENGLLSASSSAARGVMAGELSWRPWPFERVRAAVTRGQLTKAEVMTHIQVCRCVLSWPESPPDSVLFPAHAFPERLSVSTNNLLYE
jgi:hypothetical protein